MSRGLVDARILLTRPAGQAAALGRMLASRGALVLQRPTLAIEPLPVQAPPTRKPDWVVFISPNAVRYGLPALAGSGLVAGAVAAVGPGTASALNQAGVTVTVAPIRGGGAEALLAEPAFDPAPGQRVLIIRGEGGRRRLQAPLQARGVILEELAVYRRMPAACRLDVPDDWLAVQLDAAVVTSVAGLQGLLAMATPAALEWVMDAALVVVSERVAAAARQAGWVAVTVADGADDTALLAALEQALERQKDD
ncbi:uroporphyrinogen-III synthase [Spiribacter pallidus]|uniref:uroporphyrinogen-III synthase n=1 Tax=Spiribacter pallidus TaxID=1987936 RepID=UPI0034A03EB6